MTANPILLQKKYSRVIECFAKQQGLSLDAALNFFYHSQVYQLVFLLSSYSCREIMPSFPRRLNLPHHFAACSYSGVT